MGYAEGGYKGKILVSYLQAGKSWNSSSVKLTRGNVFRVYFRERLLEAGAG